MTKKEQTKEISQEIPQDEINARKAIAEEKETLTKNILHYIRIFM